MSFPVLFFILMMVLDIIGTKAKEKKSDEKESEKLEEKSFGKKSKEKVESKTLKELYREFLEAREKKEDDKFKESGRKYDFEDKKPEVQIVEERLREKNIKRDMEEAYRKSIELESVEKDKKKNKKQKIRENDILRGFIFSEILGEPKARR